MAKAPAPLGLSRGATLEGQSRGIALRPTGVSTEVDGPLTKRPIQAGPERTLSSRGNCAPAVLPRPPPNQQHHRGQLQSHRTRLGNGLNGLQNAEESIRLVVGTCRKVNLLAAAAIPVIARDQAPEAINDNWLAIGSRQLSQETGCHWVGVKDVNRSIAEVADQQVAGEARERCWRNRQSPRRIERSH